MRRAFAALFVAAAPALSIVAVPAAGHRGHDALTLVTIAADGGITVSHRFDASDVELALAAIAPDAQANLDDPAAIAALTTYLRARFTVASDAGPVALTPGKPDIDSEDVRIAFTGRAALPVHRITIDTQLLTDVYPRQVNQVNVRVGQVVRTLVFAEGGAQTIALD